MRSGRASGFSRVSVGRPTRTGCAAPSTRCCRGTCGWSGCTRCGPAFTRARARWRAVTAISSAPTTPPTRPSGGRTNGRSPARSTSCCSRVRPSCSPGSTTFAAWPPRRAGGRGRGGGETRSPRTAAGWRSPRGRGPLRARGAAGVRPGGGDFRGRGARGGGGGGEGGGRDAKPHYRSRVALAQWAPRTDGAGVTFTIEADRFLHRMVRFLVGAMVDIALGRRPLEDLPRLLVATDNQAASPPAPPQGLYLVAVHYPAHLYAEAEP